MGNFPPIGKVDFGTSTGRKAFSIFFVALILDPPPVHMLLQQKKQIPLRGLF